MNNTSKPSQELLSSKDAGTILGYTHDYISRLCRHKKMSGIQKGREWYVTQEELDAFKGRHEIELQHKKKELSKKFSRIRLEHEAKKRKARAEAPLVESKIKKDDSLTDLPSIQKSIQFKIPNQFVALAVLTLIVFGSTIFDTLSKNVATLENTSLLGQVSSSIDKGIQDTIYSQATIAEPVIKVAASLPYTSEKITSFNSIFNKGIQDMIYSQATAVEPVTTAVMSLSYVAEGFAYFIDSIAELPKAVYFSLENIGNSYLVLYLMQGEALYKTGISMNTLGLNVLQGYELVGKLLYFGGKDIIKMYARVLHLDSSVKTSQNAVQNFTANVSTGFVYAKEIVAETLFKKTTSIIISTFTIWGNNIDSNISAMQSSVNEISRNVGAYVGSVFQFNLIKKDSKIRSIEIKE